MNHDMTPIPDSIAVSKIDFINFKMRPGKLPLENIILLKTQSKIMNVSYNVIFEILSVYSSEKEDATGCKVYYNNIIKLILLIFQK